MVKLPKDNDVDMNIAMERFGDAEARDSLVRDSLAGAADDAVSPLTIADLKRAVLAGRPLATLGQDNVVPFQVMRLYRAMLTRQSIGFSRMARAARTSGDLRRAVGKFEVNVVTDDDAVFLVISPVGDVVPIRLTLLNDDGQFLSLKLAGPVNGAQQVGFATGEPRTDLLLVLLEDPGTSLFIM